jgi:hypothetical protein
MGLLSRGLGFVFGKLLGRSGSAVAEGAEQVAKEPGFLSRMMKGPAGSALKWGGGTLGVTSLLGIGYDGVTNGFKGVGDFLRQGGSKATNLPAEVASNTTIATTEFNLYGFFGLLARLCKMFKIGGGWPEMFQQMANDGRAAARDPYAAENAANQDGGGGPGFGTALVAAPLTAATGAGLYSAFKGRGGPTGGGSPSGPAGGGAPVAPAGGGAPGATNAARTVAREGAEEAVEAVARGAGRFGRFGKILALGGTATVGLGLLGGNEAEAATLPGAGTARNGSTLQNLDTGSTVAGGGVGTLQAAGAEVAGLGLSIVGARTAAETVAHAAAPVAARLGLQTVARSIPGISSIYAAGETVYNVGSDLLRGDFKKAGLNLVSGVGETVAGLGGALTYFTLGTAWREGVRGAGAMAFGEENTINHSLAVEVGGGVGSWLKEQFFGATSGAPSTTAQPSYRNNNGPAFAF